MHEYFAANGLTWIGILFCISQAGMFSGLNLAVFSVSRLKLESEAAAGSADAKVVLGLRRRSNDTLSSILWGNVSVNVLLTLLSNSVMAGMAAFFFSTVVLTMFGEIIPQAYFSRRALKIAARLYPIIMFYRILLYPAVKASTLLLDWWLGPEGVLYFREREMKEFFLRHMDSAETDVDIVESLGAINFLELDDITVSREGEPLDPDSVISLPMVAGEPVFPEYSPTPGDAFMKTVQASGKKWVIITDPDGIPRLVMDSDEFLRDALFGVKAVNPLHYCHKPIVARDPKTQLGSVLLKLKVMPERLDDDVIDQDIILLWGTHKRIITGSDILGRLMRGIARKVGPETD
jgi:hypothetical protein